VLGTLRVESSWPFIGNIQERGVERRRYRRQSSFATLVPEIASTRTR
jgi:hypothetical protein